jgi:hypothetical protein
MAEAGAPIESMSPSESTPRVERGTPKSSEKTEPAQATKKEGPTNAETQREIEDTRHQLAEIKKGEPLKLSKTTYDLLENTAEENDVKLKEHVQEGFEEGVGITPSAGENGVYSGRVFGRDAGRAAGYFLDANPKAVYDSLAKILKYPRADGALPAGVEKDYLPLRALGLNGLAKTAFHVIEGRFRGRTERPVYAGKTWYGEEDAISTIIIATGELLAKSPEEGRRLLETKTETKTGSGEKTNYEKLKDAVEFTRHKVNPKDGLIVCQENGPDWQNSINRGGELTGVNILWARSLQEMAIMASKLGYAQDAERFADQYLVVRESILTKAYNKEGHYFMASTTDARLDTLACIEGGLHLLDVEEAARMEDVLTQRVARKAGLVNFDPPYPDSQIKLWHKIQGIPDYHNKGSWPWITCENTLVKIRIAEEHPDTEVRDRFLVEAVEDHEKVAKVFQEAGGAYEFFDADTGKPGGEGSRYHTPENFISSMTMFNLVDSKIKQAGWIKKMGTEEEQAGTVR